MMGNHNLMMGNLVVELIGVGAKDFSPLLY